MHIEKWRPWGILGIALALSGCTSPLSLGNRTGDPEPMYKVENQPGGFTISTVHSRHGPDQSTVEAACRQGLVTNAADLAKSLGRPTEPIDERRARVRMSRDAVAATIKCEGSLPVRWAR